MTREVCTHGVRDGAGCTRCEVEDVLDDDAASLDGVRKILREASHEPIDPGTNMLIDAVLELTEVVERLPTLKGGDARAQLWARVYAAEYEVFRREQGDSRNRQVLSRDGIRTIGEYAQTQAREAADAAVRDFDEHYLGGKR